MILVILIAILSCVIIGLKYKHNLRWKDIFSYARIRSVYAWILKKQLKIMGETNTYLTKDQILNYSYRVARCGDCLQAGKCKFCNCDVEGKMNNATDFCDHIREDGKQGFGVMYTKEEMDNLLTKYSLDFKVKINDKV